MDPVNPDAAHTEDLLGGRGGQHLQVKQILNESVD